MSSPLTVEMVAIGDLVPDPANPRRIDAAQLDALTESIRAYGLTQPILARREDRVVAGGNQRLVAAARLGHTHVPVVWLDLSASDARALGLALNRISGTWDETLLARTLDDLRLAGSVDLALTGFGDDEIDRLLASLRAQERRAKVESFDLDAALALGRQTRTATGDVWRLGDHRLVVGDATDPAVIDRLLDGARPAMAFVDPPYGVAFGDHGGQARGGRQRRIANDNLVGDEWVAFVRAWATMVVARTDGALYVCMSSKAWPVVAGALEAAGGHWSDTIIWRKDRFVLGRADLQRAYEPIWYGWREGAAHHWCGDRDQSDVWEIDRPSASPLHAMMKPLALVERAIRNSSRPADLVFDAFAGAGTTLIAAERTGRRCAAVELDARYADVILARYEAFAGTEAVRLTSRGTDVEPGA